MEIEGGDDGHRRIDAFRQDGGWTLARAHAKSGHAEGKISGYLGNTDNFDEAMGSFAADYADQMERDHAALKAAVRAGKIEVLQLEE